MYMVDYSGTVNVAENHFYHNHFVGLAYAYAFCIEYQDKLFQCQSIISLPPIATLPIDNAATSSVKRSRIDLSHIIPLMASSNTLAMGRGVLCSKMCSTSDFDIQHSVDQLCETLV